MKEFVKGTATETQQEVTEMETDSEATKEMIRANEEDFIQGLIEAADFAESETQRIEITRGGKLFFAFRIHPLSAAEYEKCRKKHSKYTRNKQLGMKMLDEVDTVKYKSMLIYEATVKEDQEKLWENRSVWNAINAKKDRILSPLDAIDCVLKAGEKDAVIEAIDRLSGFENDLEEVAKN